MTTIVPLFKPKQTAGGGNSVFTLAKRAIWVATAVQLPVYGDLIRFTKLAFDGPGAKWTSLEEKCKDLPEGKAVILNMLGIEDKYIPLVLRDAVGKKRIMLVFNKDSFPATEPPNAHTVMDLVVDMVDVNVPTVTFWPDHLLIEEARRQFDNDFTETFLLNC